MSSSLGEIPIGIRFVPSLGSRKAYVAMRELETQLGLRLTVGDEFFVPDLDLSKGDVVELPTDYGFYCDADQNTRIATCLMLICSGQAPDGPKTRNLSTTGMSVRLLTRRPANRTTLVIVPDHSIQEWLNYLQHTSLVFNTVGTEEEVSACSIKKLRDLDLLLVSSSFYQRFSSRIRGLDGTTLSRPLWSRVIIQESLAHSKIVNSDLFHEQASFTWYLTPNNPCQWINHPEVRERFLARGIYQSRHCYPEIFSVKNDPQLLVKYIEATPPLPDLNEPNSSFCPILHQAERQLAEIANILVRTKIELSRSYHNACEAYRDEFRRVVEEGMSSFHLLAGRISLETYQEIVRIARRRSLSENETDSNQKKITMFNMEVMRLTCGELLQGISLKHQKMISKAAQKVDELIRQKSEASQQEDIRLNESYQARMDELVNRLIDSSSQAGNAISSTPIPVYMVERFGSEEVTMEEIAIHARVIPPGYIQAYGQAKAKTILTVAREARAMNLIIALANGIQVMAKISKRKHIMVMLLAKGSKELTSYQQGFPPLYEKEYVHLETMLIVKDSTFILACKTDYLTPSGTRGSLKPGTEIILA